MALDLAAPISAYFSATNSHDGTAVARLFSPNGVVRDEGLTMHGAAAIRDWADGTFTRYDVTLTPRDVEQAGRETIVTTAVEGNFEGSPIELEFRFETAEEGITSLLIE